MSPSEGEFLELESFEENPELLEHLHKLASRINRDLELTLSKVTLRRDEVRSRLGVRRFEGSPSRFLSVLAVDSTWSIPHLELVMGSVAVIVAGYVIVAPRGLGSCGLSFVSLRVSSGDLEGRFTTSLELSAKVKEYVTALRQLGKDVDLVMLDGPLYHSMIPEFYTPSRVSDVLWEARRVSGLKLASLASRALLDLLGKADNLNVPVVGVVKRVSSRLLLHKVSDIREVAEILARYNDKLLASLILEPGEYIVLDSFLESFRRYLELQESKARFQRLLRLISYCLEAPRETLEGRLCNYMDRTAVVFYKHRGLTVTPQATRLDVYPASRVDDVVAYAMESTTENSVPAPIDYVDRYVRVESSTIRRLHQLLRAQAKTLEAYIAQGVTNPQKRYLYEWWHKGL